MYAHDYVVSNAFVSEMQRKSKRLKFNGPSEIICENFKLFYIFKTFESEYCNRQIRRFNDIIGEKMLPSCETLKRLSATRNSKEYPVIRTIHRAVSC